MERILAGFSPDPADEGMDGLYLMYCPVCGRKYHQRNIETYYKGTTDRRVELCTNCREDFEGDEDVSLEADVLDDRLFDLLFNWMKTQ